VKFEFGLYKPKFYPDLLRFCEVIREKPILTKYIVTLPCVCMT